MKTNSLEIQQVSPLDLKPNSWNTNVVSVENEAKIEASMDRYGIFKPILVRTLDSGDFEILGGAHRTEAAIRKGIDLVPIINLGNLDDSRAKEISLVDNGRYGADDALKLTDLLNSLDSSHDEFSTFLPYSNDEIESLFSTTIIALDDLDLDDDEDLDSEPVTLPTNTNKSQTQIMRFKVNIEDAESVTKMFETIMKDQELTEEDSLTNAGDALVWLVNHYEDK